MTVSDFSPRSMEWVAGKLGVPVNGTIETCRTVYPMFDLGHEEVVDIGGPFNGIPHLVYATIDKGGRQRCRSTAFPVLWRARE